MKRIIALFLAFAIISALLVSCGKKDKIFGEWLCTAGNAEIIGTVYAFYEDGTAEHIKNGVSTEYTFSLEKDKIYLYAGNNTAPAVVYTYDFDGGILKLTDKNGRVFNFEKY